MEGAIFDIADLVVKSKNPLEVVLWMALVGIFVWLPSLLSFISRYRYGQPISHFILAFGFIPIIQLAAAPFIRPILRVIGLGSYWRCSNLSLHLIALCLLAIWAWLQALQARQKGSRENVSEVVRDLVRRDWILVVRLALWLTLSLMPIVKWA